MPEAITIKPYESVYRDEIIQMVSKARAAMGLNPAVREDLYDIQSNYIDRGDTFLLATDEQGELLGCVGYKRIGETNEAFLHRFYVKAEYKRRGIGSKLLYAAEARMRENGIRASRVHLGEDPKIWHESYAFYPKRGYILYAPRYMIKTL